MSLDWRPLTSADAKAGADLLNAMEVVDQVGEFYDEQDALEELTDPYAELERASLAAFDGDVMVGFMKCRYQPDAERIDRIVIDGGVAPDYRRQGLGTRLLTAGLAAAEQSHARHHPTLPLVIDIHRLEGIAGLAELLTSHGFTPARYYQNMRHPLGAAIPGTALPDGLLIEPWSEQNDEEFRLIRNEAFQDDYLWAPLPVDAWRSEVHTSGFRPTLSFLVRDGAFPVAMLVTMSWDANTAATGVRDARFMLIATLPAHRRRGIGGALLAHGLRAAADQGYDRVLVQVDSANPFRSFRLYEEAGFTPARRFVRWALEVGFGAAPPAES